MGFLFRVTGIIIALVLLLTVFVDSAQASQTVHASADDDDPADDMALICLSLVGGTAILAGGVWLRKLRGMLS